VVRSFSVVASCIDFDIAFGRVLHLEETDIDRPAMSELCFGLAKQSTN
jgi:hypothetical protein